MITAIAVAVLVASVTIAIGGGVMFFLKVLVAVGFASVLVKLGPFIVSTLRGRVSSATESLKIDEAAYIIDLLAIHGIHEGTEGIAMDIGTGYHGVGLRQWVRHFIKLTFYPTDCSHTELGGDHAGSVVSKLVRHCNLDVNFPRCQELPSRWLRLDVFEDETSWQILDDGRDVAMCRLRGRVRLITVIDFLSYLVSGDSMAGCIRRRRVLRDLLHHLDTFLAPNGVAVWLDNDLFKDGTYGKILDCKEAFKQVVSSFGLEATPFSGEDCGEGAGLVFKRADQSRQRCNYCGLRGEAPLKTCLCGIAQYCSTACQKSDFTIHMPVHKDMLEHDGRAAHDFKHMEDVVALAQRGAAPPIYSNLPPPPSCEHATKKIESALAEVCPSMFS